MSEIKLVIFDCDGVMFDSRMANKVYYNKLLEKFGRPPMDEAEIDYVHSHNVMDSVTHIFRRYPEDIEGAHRYRLTLDYSPFLEYMQIEPDLKDFLNFLKPKYYTAISTNRSTTMPALMEKHSLEPLFDMVVTSLDVENPKPHAEALHKILDHFNLTVHDSIYIGDSMVDRQHTAAVNMPLIAFKNPGLPAEFHVSSFNEIRELPIFT